MPAPGVLHRSPCLTRTASLAVCLLLLLNGAFSHFIDGTFDYDPLLATIQQQSTLLGYTSFTAIPVKIVNQLMEESGFIPSPLKAKEPPQKKKNNKSSACDFAIVSSPGKMSENKGYQRHKFGKEPFFVINPAAVSFAYSAVTVRRDPMNGGILILLLLLILLLPRGSIEEPSRLVNNRLKRKAQPGIIPIGLFLILGGK